MPDSGPYALDTWIAIDVGGVQYLINAGHISEMLQLSSIEVTPLPTLPDEYAGVMQLRHGAVTLLDLRRAFLLPPLSDETSTLLQMFTDREQDHVNWLKELELSVNENRPFQLATDPHKCKFGRWYDEIMSDDTKRLKITRDNSSFNRLLIDFDKPHQSIHAIAHDVIELVAHEKQSEALALIHATRDSTLHRMIDMFDRVRRLVTELHVSMVVLLETEHATLGIQVDQINSIVRMTPDEIAPLPAGVPKTALIRGLHKNQTSDSHRISYILDIDALALHIRTAAEPSAPVLGQAV